MQTCLVRVDKKQLGKHQGVVQALEKIFFFDSVRLLDELLVKLFAALFAELSAGLLSDLLGTCPPFLFNGIVDLS